MIVITAPATAGGCHWGSARPAHEERGLLRFLEGGHDGGIPEKRS